MTVINMHFCKWFIYLKKKNDFINKKHFSSPEEKNDYECPVSKSKEAYTHDLR